MKPALILFDIDGTLLLSGRAGLRAMTRAFEQTFGITDAFAGEHFGGRTDSYLVSKALQKAGLPDTPEQHDRFRDDYIPLLAEEIQHPGTGHKGLMPGAKELLEALDEHHHLHLALLTGNYREAAEIKLQHFELWDFFEWGAFSATMRPIAMRSCRSRSAAPRPTTFRSRRSIASSSSATRRTISNARASPAPDRSRSRPAASRCEQLREFGADDVLPDLSDTEAVLALLI